MDTPPWETAATVTPPWERSAPVRPQLTLPVRESTTAGGPQMRTAGAPGAGAHLASEMTLPSMADIKAALPDAEDTAAVYKDVSRPAVAIPKFTIQPDDHPATAVGKEAVNILTSLPEFFESPLGVATAGAGSVIPRMVATVFTADTLHTLGKQVEDTHANWKTLTPGQKAAAVTDIVGSGAMATLLAHGAVRGVPGTEPTPAAKTETPPWETPTEAPVQTPGPATLPAAVVAPWETAAAEKPSEPAVTQGAPAPLNEQPSPPVPAMAPAGAAASPSAEPIPLAADLNAGALGNVGMGGAKPEEFDPVKPLVTGIRNAVVDQDRAARGLPPAMAAAKQSFGDWWDEAMQRVDDNPKASEDLVSELQSQPRPVTPVENALLLHRQVDLSNQLNKALLQAAPDYHTPGSPAEEDARLQVARLQDDLQSLYDVTKSVGSEQGRGLAARNMLAKEDFSLAAMQQQKRAVNGGTPLTPEQVAEVTEQNHAIAGAQQAADEHDAKVDDSESRRAGTEMVNDMTSKVNKEPSQKRDLPAEQQNIVAGLKQAVGNQEPIQNLGSYIQRLAENFIRQGVREREPLVDAVHGVLTKQVDPKDHPPADDGCHLGLRGFPTVESGRGESAAPGPEGADATGGETGRYPSEEAVAKDRRGTPHPE